jgi:hypothetical protein
MTAPAQAAMTGDSASADAAGMTTAATTATHTIECPREDFIGSAKVTITQTALTFTATVDEYKIDKLNDVKGGDSANIDFYSAYRHEDRWYAKDWTESPDTFKQDGKWHEWGGVNSIPAQQGKLHATILRFIFDKSDATDYACEVWVGLAGKIDPANLP